jgi:DNA transformation protein and related proteins
MASSQTFVDHVLDLVSLLGQPVQARRMFGGHGLYARGAMFGLLDDDELFLKTDEETRPRFVEAGCRRWVYGEMRETSYFRPPDEAHEDATAMLPWARLALEAALRGKAAAAARAAARPKKATVSVRSAGQATGAQPRRPRGAQVRRTGPRRPR